jgi:hypothetical protein
MAMTAAAFLSTFVAGVIQKDLSQSLCGHFEEMAPPFPFVLGNFNQL